MPRRTICLLLCLLLVLSGTAVGEEALRGYDKKAGYVYVTLGQYPQTIDGGTPGDKNLAWKWKGSVIPAEEIPEVAPEPILWRVLKADDGQVWILSEYILFASPMNTDYIAYRNFKGDFTQTELYAKLNGEFLETAFTPEEAEMLAEGEFGKVFILSTGELKDKTLGFTGNEARKAWATEYAVRISGSFVYQMKMGCSSPYWTRTPSQSKEAAGRAAQCTKQTGAVGYYNTSNPEEGARPSVYLIPGTWQIDGGSGTKEDPFRIVPVAAKTEESERGSAEDEQN